MAKSKGSRTSKGQLVLLEENTRLKRQVKDLQGALQAWQRWQRPITEALVKDDNLRAIALFKGETPNGKAE